MDSKKESIRRVTKGANTFELKKSNNTFYIYVNEKQIARTTYEDIANHLFTALITRFQEVIMTFRQILIMMGGFHDAVANDLMSRGSADGIIQHLLEQRGIYGSKDQIAKEGKEGVLVNNRSQRPYSQVARGSCQTRTEVYRELVLRRHARLLREVPLSRMSNSTFTQTMQLQGYGTDVIMAAKKNVTAEEHAHASKKARTHTIYKNLAGERIPGTTTITGGAAKQQLVKWANKLGLQGIEVEKYVDELATIGTLAHYLIECHCLKIEPNLGDATPNQLELARNSFNKWLSWQDMVGFVPEHNEIELVSERFQFGGTIDIIGTLTKRNNRRALVDIKTCKAIYTDAKTQVSGGYMLIAQEHVDSLGPIDDVIITRVGRNSEEGFEEIVISSQESFYNQTRFIDLRCEYENLKLTDTYKGPCKNPEKAQLNLAMFSLQKVALMINFGLPINDKIESLIGDLSRSIKF